MTLPRLPRLFAAVPEPISAMLDLRAPWSLLGDPLTDLLHELPMDGVEIALTPEVHLFGPHLVIGLGTRIQPGAVIEGPVYIGRDVQIRTGVTIRGGCWIGDGCVIGANTEIKRSVLLPGARAPHLNYVGDSILGSRVNLGAGTVLSNFRHDGRTIRIHCQDEAFETGRRKLGAILGDNVLTGCNAVLNPGVIVGEGTQLYPGVQLRSGVYPEHSIIKLRQNLEIVKRDV